MTDKPSQHVASPCIRQCCLDQNDICVGCFRSLDEILNWTTISDDKKRDVIAMAKQRKIKVKSGL